MIVAYLHSSSLSLQSTLLVSVSHGSSLPSLSLQSTLLVSVSHGSSLPSLSLQSTLLVSVSHGTVKSSDSCDDSDSADEGYMEESEQETVEVTEYIAVVTGRGVRWGIARGHGVMGVEGTTLAARLASDSSGVPGMAPVMLGGAGCKDQ